MTTRNLPQQRFDLNQSTKSAASPQHGRKSEDADGRLKAKLQEKRSFEPRQAH